MARTRDPLLRRQMLYPSELRAPETRSQGTGYRGKKATGNRRGNRSQVTGNRGSRKGKSKGKTKANFNHRQGTGYRNGRNTKATAKTKLAGSSTAMNRLVVIFPKAQIRPDVSYRIRA